MQLNEHDSKILFQESGIPTPQGILLQRESIGNLAADMSAESLSVPLPWMLKIQVLAGGRGKQGGVVALDSPEELPRAAQKLFDLEVNGRTAPFLRLEHRANIEREFYLSLSLQREWGCPVLTIGRQGGVEVETIGAKDPDNLLVQRLNPLAGLGAHQIRAAFFHLGLEKTFWPGFHSLLNNLWDCFTNNGLLLTEINPLVLTREDQWLALDGKIEVDDNFADLRPEVKRFAREIYFSDQENRANSTGLSYHRFEGRVGLMVNGAGLAMATMDLLNHSGMQPANFLDLGGGAGQQAMDEAMNILLGDPQVEAVLINLFGGILSCEKVAMALKTALGGEAPVKPLVVRFSGHGADAGRSLLSDVPGKTLHLADDLNQALDILQDILQADFTSSEEFLLSPAPGVDSVRKKSFGANRAYGSGSLVTQPFGLGRTSRVLVQGLTGREGRRHAELMREYGVQVVAGVTPFKEGENVIGLPVYSSVARATARHQIDASIIFVPASVAADAVLEAAQANVPWIICITEGIPQMEMLTVLEQLKGSNSRLIGPNTPGLIVPGEIKIGIMPGGIFSPGPVAVLSRSGTLTYEAVHRLGAAGIGQSVCIGVGGDPYVGLGLKACAELVVADPRTKALLILGEIGGRAEEETAEHLRAQGWTGPILAFIAGRTAPEGKRLGHAGAILEKGGGGIQAKLDRLQTAGVTLCTDLDDVARLTGEALDMI